MTCPVCGKEARARVYYCARCGGYMHGECWREYVERAHKE